MGGASGELAEQACLGRWASGGTLLAFQLRMKLVVGNRPFSELHGVRFFHMMGPTNQGAENEDLGPPPEPEREPGSRPDGEPDPPEELDPKDPPPTIPEPDEGIDPPPNEAPIKAPSEKPPAKLPNDLYRLLGGNRPNR